MGEVMDTFANRVDSAIENLHKDNEFVPGKVQIENALLPIVADLCKMSLPDAIAYVREMYDTVNSYHRKCAVMHRTVVLGEPWN
jgi:hypothetical protein